MDKTCLSTWAGRNSPDELMPNVLVHLSSCFVYRRPRFGPWHHMVSAACPDVTLSTDPQTGE